MIKAIIFDLDGVLVDARELHYEALNRALASIDEKYRINRDEHLSTYDGLPTTKKLELLTANKGLPEDKYDEVWTAKQFQTREIIDKEFVYDEKMRSILRRLRDDNYRMAVCSNSIRETTKMMLVRKGLIEFVDFFISNQDVKRPKPNPEMYLSAMVKFGVGPKECVIVEDSHIGRQAVFESGAHLCAVKNTDDVEYEKVIATVHSAAERNNGRKFIPKWQGRDMNIIIPMAGEGRRFRDMGYSFPKPLVDINGKPMIQWVIENINVEGNFIYIVRKEDYDKYNLKYLLNLLTKNCRIVVIDHPTQGAVKSVLEAGQWIDDNPVSIVNSDQYIGWNSNEFFYAMTADECDGGIVTFESTHPKWSFVKLDKSGFILETAEKKVISNCATAGVYYFKKGSDFLKYAHQMIDKEMTVDGQYFVCPVYNELIKDKKKVRAFHVSKFWSFSTPEDVEHFITKSGGMSHG